MIQQKRHKFGRNIGNTWTFALTRRKQISDNAARLSLGRNRIQILGLASKRGVQTWLGKVCNCYGGDLQTSRLRGFTEQGWSKPQQPFLLVTVPMEGRADVERLAERNKLELSPMPPRDPIIKQTHRTLFAEYPPLLFNGDNLFYPAYVGRKVARTKVVTGNEERSI